MSNALPGQADGQEQPPLALRLAHALAEVRRAERRYVEGPERRATPPRSTASLPGLPRIERVGRATVRPAHPAPAAPAEAPRRVRDVTRGKIVREGPPLAGAAPGEAAKGDAYNVAAGGGAFDTAESTSSALEESFPLTVAPGLLRRAALKDTVNPARGEPMPAPDTVAIAVPDEAAEAADALELKDQSQDAAAHLDVAAALAEVRAELAEVREQARQAGDELAQVRRSSREALAGVPGSGSEVIVAIIPVVDDLERALAYLPAALRGDAWVEGVLMIGGRLRAALEQHGVACEVPRGATFDPRRHEAVSRLETADVPEDTITEVILPGYSLNGRVLRAAQVQVAVRKDQ